MTEMTNCRLEIAEANCRSLTPIRKGGGWVRDDNARWGAAHSQTENCKSQI